MEEEGGENGKRRIKLFCPSVSKLVQIIAGEEQKLDLGSISRAFGLHPNTLKLNGYFISRGVDLIASSMTWKSLIGFFSARGLSTGAADSDALIVDGKLCKSGSKRKFDLDESNNSCSKRKWWLEDESHLKRRRSSEEDVSGLRGAPTNSPFSCSVIGKNLKRLRVDEIVGTPSKKIR